MGRPVVDRWIAGIAGAMAIWVGGCGDAQLTSDGAEPGPRGSSIDKPDAVVTLPIDPSYMACSDGRIFAQSITPARVFIVNWQAVDKEPEAVASLTPNWAVLVKGGRVLNAVTFVDWLRLGGNGKGPVSPVFLAAHKEAMETMTQEPYLREYQKLGQRPLILRQEGKAEAQAIEDIAKDWCPNKFKVTHDGLFAAICLTEDCGVTQGSSRREKIRLGVYRDAEKKATWVDGLRGDADNRHWPSIESVARAPDGSKVAVIGSNGSGGWSACVDTVNQKVLWDLRGKGDAYAFHDGDFSADGKTFCAGGTDGQLFVYEAETGKTLGKWPVGERIERVVASPDGKLVALGLADAYGTVCPLDAQTGAVKRKITTGSGNIRGIGFSPDSKMLAAAGCTDSRVRIYKLESPAAEQTDESPKKE